MTMSKLTKGELKYIDSLVKIYVDNSDIFERFSDNFSGLFIKNKKLKPFIHSVKWRIKDPKHLRDKLIRKWILSKEKGKTFSINENNLFNKINDLVGVRILHLYTKQFDDINKILNEILHQELYEIIEGPIAKTWDDESRAYFKEIGIKTQESKSLYTSIHYIVKANNRAQLTGEIQVRTLAEELWGEVDHTINYPHPCNLLACKEQILVLARVTSSCTRLVDSIFTTYSDSK